MNVFKNIYGQDLAIEILESAISKEHLSSAYLFSGPEGVGRRKTAKVFIETILDKNFDNENTKRRIETNNHPDLLWIEPSYLVQGKSISQSQARIENISMKSPPQIRHNQIKEIIIFLGKKPLESKRKIVIIEDLEKINESASNALLKTLEEPNTGLFILIAQSPEKLLSTIRSRCQIVPFIRLNDNQVKKIIHPINVSQNMNNISSEQLQVLMDFSYGSPGKYQINLQYWSALSIPLKQKIEVKLTNPIELLELAKLITDELNLEQQIWLISYLQNKIWRKEKSSYRVKKLEELRKQILSFVQPRLAWEVCLLEMNLNN
tara:strand:- start:771 stop:1730 length:960 start_codon:yes stop_codon:yes gene_type:complete